MATLVAPGRGDGLARDRVDEGRRALDEVRSRSAGLRTGGKVPTAGAVAVMRERRDDRWRVIRGAYVGASRLQADTDETAGGRAAEFEVTVRGVTNRSIGARPKLSA